MVNLAPREVLSTVPEVVFHLLNADEPEVKSVLNSHLARPVSAEQVARYSQLAIVISSIPTSAL
jgi:hypothetical protein